MNSLKELLYKIYLRSPSNLFDEFIKECIHHYSKPAHNLQELKIRENKKIKGDIFEEFCVLYLKHIKGYDNSWRLENVPDLILEKLSLKRKDMGIDLIIEKDGVYSAVQCKYKTPVGLKKMGITWKILSTFYSLCMRTGPWDKYIVMTNCNFVRHVGKKTDKDVSIVLSSFQKINKEDWMKMCNVIGTKLQETDVKEQKEEVEEVEEVTDLESLREKRLAYFQSNKLI
jgi:hypothetical protein